MSRGVLASCLLRGTCSWWSGGGRVASRTSAGPGARCHPGASRGGRAGTAPSPGEGLRRRAHQLVYFPESVLEVICSRTTLGLASVWRSEEHTSELQSHSDL